MDPVTLYHMLHTEPFEPFRLHLTDGRGFDIRYSDMNVVGTTWIRIGIVAPDDKDPDPIADHSVKVPLSLISRVERLSAVPTPGSN